MGTFRRMVPLLLLSLHAAVNLSAQGTPEQPWPDEYLDRLARSWPENMIENAPSALRWSPLTDTALTILQLGDSHVQGDLAARATRALFSASYNLPMPARGYTFPFGAVGSNEPAEIRSRAHGSWLPIVATRFSEAQPVGLAGAAIETSSLDAVLRLSLIKREQLSPPPTRISVFYAPFEGAPVPLVNERLPESIDTSLGVAIFSFSEPLDAIKLTLRAGDTAQAPFRLLGFSFQDEASPFLFHAAGLNGADGGTHLKNSALQFDIERINPRIVFVALGTNDAYNSNFSPELFRANLSQLVETIQLAAPTAFVVLITPNDHLLSDGEVNPRIALAAEVIRNLSADLDLGLWDFHRIMGGEGSIFSWGAHGLAARDHLHLSPVGYALQGRLLAVALHKLLTRR